MEFSGKTKVYDLVEKYPFIIDYLIKQSSHFERLKNPMLRKTLGKVADLNKAAGIAGLPVEELLAGIAAEIKAQTGEEPAMAGAAPAAALVSDPAARQEALKAIIRDLHAGGDMNQLKERFRAVIRDVNAPEIAAMEQQLINEGMPAEEVKRLCDVHVEIFKEALEERDLPRPPAGHPVHTFMKENRASEKIMSQAALLIGKLGHPPTAAALAAHKPELERILAELSQVDIHYARKENQLFPLLEAHHFSGPSQVMWSFHDDIRGNLKAARQALAQGEPVSLADNLHQATNAMRDMIYKEEHILYPTSLDMLSEAEWRKVKEGEADIGYAWVQPDPGWPAKAAAPAAAAEPAPAALPRIEGALELSTGRLTAEQVNLLLTHLPLDVTFVDQNDRVAYYSEGPERIFPRSPAVIGREVRNCHPPKSVHVVNKILDAFKSGYKDSAEFWIQMGPRFIHIRYFAVRDKQGQYQGVLEVSQDVTGIKKLEGNQRLLDWE
ncbi:MAG: DUF438 domain-containing protein [Desulfarculus sp.]|nr:MAG: DUF438 domain-containing protein [Desulfarculus sp.]